MTKTFRTLATLAVASLVLGALVVGPADAKKKKPKKPPVVPVCAPYTPYEAAAGAPVTTLTDAATAEAPIEIKITTEPGVGAGRDAGGEGALVSHGYANVLVDTSATSTGLWGSVEFTPVWDYDLYLDDGEGIELGASGGVGPEQDANTNDSSTDVGSETITGYTAGDCTGYTFDIVGATTPGEEVTVKLWLGEAKF